MASAAALVLVWLGAQRPEGRVKAALDSWAAARDVTLQDARAEPLDRDTASPVAELCDRDLDEARDQLNAGDFESAHRTLSRVEQALRDHPDLYQAGWLMAERYRLAAQIAARTSGDIDGWLARANALEGTRAPSFGETRVSEKKMSEVSVSLLVRGARKHETYWDGSRSGDQLSTVAGEHHLAIARGNRMAWSGWVSVLVPGTIEIWISDAPACSTEDLDGVTVGSESIVGVPNGVACDTWVAADLGTRRGTVRAALCHRDRCEAASTWAYELFETKGAGPELHRKNTLAPWAAWTLAGVGAAAATTFILWQSGVFDRSTPTPQVIYDGSHL